MIYLLDLIFNFNKRAIWPSNNNVLPVYLLHDWIAMRHTILLSIEVINGSLPTREVYQYNHRWSVAHNVKFYQKNKHVDYFLKEMTEVISLKDAFKILDVYSYNLTCRMICEQFGEQTWFQSIDLYIAENHVKCAGDTSVNSCMKSQQVWIAKQIIYFWSVMKVAQQFVIRI